LDGKNSKSKSRLGRALASQGKPVVGHLVVSTIADEGERATAHQRLTECHDQPTLFLGKVIVKGLAQDQFGIFAAYDLLPGELVLRERRICKYTRADVITEPERAKEVLDFLDTREGQKLDDAVEGVFPRGRGVLPAMLERVTELSGPEITRTSSDLRAAAHVFSVMFFSSFEVGLFSFASLFNHSCGANCCVSVLDAEQGVLEWRTTRPVLKGEELTFSYLALEMLCLPVFSRRTMFAQNWGGGAVCECARCAEEMETGPDKDVTPTVTQLERHFFGVLTYKTKDVDKFGESFKNYIDKASYNFTNEKIEQMMRGKSDFEWKGKQWKELIIYNWFGMFFLFRLFC
jgi:hypothetical protein